MSNDWCYDIECLPNIFTCAFEHREAPFTLEFEISQWVNQSAELVAFLYHLRDTGGRLFGYNNLDYDYNLLHFLLKAGRLDAMDLYAKSQVLIKSDERFGQQVWQSDRIVPQVDVMRLNHYEYRSVKATSLKALEFSMRSESIEELPYPFDRPLLREQVAGLKSYNRHDVSQTKKFTNLCADAIRFREDLARKYPNKDWLNFNDVKIGVEYFVMRLEKAGIECYFYGPEGRKPRQTLRQSIALNDAILPGIVFEEPAFQRVLEHLRAQTIVETKGVFKDLTAVVGGLEYVFGLGGIHASVSNEIVIADDKMMILDIDVEAYYPSTMIAQRFKPAHYPDLFCDIYAGLKEERRLHKKGTAENALLKLSANGVFGKTNDQYSVFFDSLVTMQTTLNGQLLLCKLVEQLLKIPGLRVVQANTDGLSLHLPRSMAPEVRRIVTWWEQLTLLKMEFAEYNLMAIRDVNNYLAQKVDGSVKTKGAYQSKREHHQNSSALVAPKVAEQVLLHGAPIRETVMNWPDRMDFMLRVKVPRSSYLSLDGVQVQNVCRYYVSKSGGTLTKWMPPLKDKTEWRQIAVESGWKVCVCNQMKDATMPVDHDYYVDQVERLVLGLK